MSFSVKSMSRIPRKWFGCKFTATKDFEWICKLEWNFYNDLRLNDLLILSVYLRK